MNSDKGIKSSIKCFKYNKIGHKSFQRYSKNTGQGKS